MDLSGVVAWEAVSYSSQELPHEASNLNSASSAKALQSLLAASAVHAESRFTQGWQSEKFCEYPQELVFHVSTSVHSPCPTPAIHSIVVVSDPTLIPQQIEIFLSTTPTTHWKNATFHRLGYITLRSPQQTQCTAQELKTVPIQQCAVGAERITFVRLLVHSCHVHTTNLFNQVGLCCALALSDPLDWTQRYDEEKLLTKSNSRLALRPWPTLTMGASSSLPSLRSTAASTAIWDAVLNQYVTASELLTRIQLARERHSVSIQSTLRTDDDHRRFQEDQRAWLLDELECKQLEEQMSDLHHAEAIARTVGDRIAVHKQLDEGLKSLTQLAARIHLREAAMHRRVSDALAQSPVKTTKQLLGRSSTKPVLHRQVDWTTLDQWQSREEFVWSIVESVKLWAEQDASDRPELLNDALQIARTGLDDSHPQIFLAASALLQIVILHHPRFHDGSAWKHDVVALIKQLTKRLDDLQPVVRNNAAFSIIKIAEHTRARSSFVLHHLLQMIENKELQLTEQTLYGVIKVVSALLQAFHCCAKLDVSPTRVFKLLLTSDAVLHANGHVRRAARELLVVLHEQVGGEAITKYFRKKKLPAEAVRSMEALFAVLAQK